MSKTNANTAVKILSYIVYINVLFLFGNFHLSCAITIYKVSDYRDISSDALVGDHRLSVCK